MDLKNIATHEILANHCTYHIGGPAHYFLCAANENEIINGN